MLRKCWQPQHYNLVCVSIVLFAHTRYIAYGLLTIHFPSVIRGWLVRRNASDFNNSKKSRENARSRRRSRVRMPEEKVLYGACFLKIFGKLIDLVNFLFVSCMQWYLLAFIFSIQLKIASFQDFKSEVV